MNKTKPSSLKAQDKRKGRIKTSMDDIELFLLHLPTTIWYFLFCYAPMIGVIIAFKNYRPRPGKNFFWSLFNNSQWAGFDNFRFLFNSKDAFLMFRNTIGYNLIFIILGILIPVTLAILINELYSKKMSKVCQTAMFLPHFLSWVVISYFVFAFLSTDRGLINRAMLSMGVSGALEKNWYMDLGFWTWFLVFLNVWKGTGYAMVVYLATISGFDMELYEAALIDGASKGQQVRYITLPQLRPIVSIMFIMAVGGIFRSDFGLFYQATRDSGALADITTTIDVYVYRALIQRPNINYASAATLVQSIFGLVTILAANKLVKRIDPESGMF